MSPVILKAAASAYLRGSVAGGTAVGAHAAPLHRHHLGMKRKDALHERVAPPIAELRRRPLTGFSDALVDILTKLIRPFGLREAIQMTKDHVDGILDNLKSRSSHHVSSRRAPFA